MKDLYHDFRSTYVIKPQVFTSANANGTVLDLLGYRGALIAVHLGASGAEMGASNKVTVVFKSSTDGTNLNDIATTDLIGGANAVLIDANGEANTTIQRTYIGAERYVTVNIEATAGAVSLPVCASVLRGKPIHSPIA